MTVGAAAGPVSPGPSIATIGITTQSAPLPGCDGHRGSVLRNKAEVAEGASSSVSVRPPRFRRCNRWRGDDDLAITRLALFQAAGARLLAGERGLILVAVAVRGGA